MNFLSVLSIYIDFILPLATPMRHFLVTLMWTFIIVIIINICCNLSLFYFIFVMDWLLLNKSAKLSIGSWQTTRLSLLIWFHFAACDALGALLCYFNVNFLIYINFQVTTLTNYKWNKLRAICLTLPTVKSQRSP